MYIYDRQSSGSQYRRKEQPATLQPSQRYKYPNPSQGQSGFWGQGLGQAAAVIDMDRAVHLNRYYARSLGWQSHVHRIIRFLGFTIYNPDERTFAKAVARWQWHQGLPSDGVIGPTTWSRLHHVLSRGSGSAESRKKTIPSTYSLSEVMRHYPQ
jgi:murein L,D-transpeptidase YcbB/YkuD